MRYRVGLVALALAGTAVAGVPTSADAARSNCQAITHRAIYGKTENQVAGVKWANKWGFAEVDARVTADGKVVAVHDVNMTRLSGGKSNAAIHRTNFEDLLKLPYVYGKRIYTTARLIRVAAKQDRRIMVTINSWKRVKDAGFADQVLDTLWNAAQKHPHPNKVYFGGPGSRQAMEERHPEASTFFRYGGSDSVKKHAVSNGIDLVAIPPSKFKARIVRHLRKSRLTVASTQLVRKAQVRRANRAGIRLVQVDRAKKAVKQWCTRR